MTERNNVIKYKNNYLTNVVVQIDYSPVKRFFEDIPRDIIEKLKGEYIFQQGIPVKEVQVNMNTGARIETAIPVWVFKSSDNYLIIQLLQNVIKFDFTKYTTFEDLMFHVKKVTSLLDNDVKSIMRLGLRYINQIDLEEGSPADWSEYIDDSLIAPIEKWCMNSKLNIARVMSQIVLNEEEYSLNFNYGIFNPIFPNSIMQKQFILDFDCSCKNIEFTELNDYLYKFNLAITNSFEKSIKEPLRKKMVKINE